MDPLRFDRWTKTSFTRRRAARVAGIGTLGGLFARAGLADPALACRKAGRPCPTAKACCSGVCRKGRCRCPGGTARCGGDCCTPGQLCLPIFIGSDIKICINGPKQPGDDCDPAIPATCASGVCGCYEDECSCREATCKPYDGDCEGLAECCDGYCNFGSFRCDD